MISFCKGEGRLKGFLKKKVNEEREDDWKDRSFAGFSEF